MVLRSIEAAGASPVCAGIIVDVYVFVCVYEGFESSVAVDYI